MGRTSSLLLLIWIGGIFSAYSQINRYVVFFEDKAGSKYSVDRPEEFLSDKAIQRRLNQNIEIGEQDLPVTASNLNAVSAAQVNVFYTSKWLNAALVEAEETALDELVEQGVVSNFELAAPGQKLADSPNKYTINYTPQEPSSVGSNSENQLNMLGALDMHNDGYDGEGIWIAVFDAGFEGVNESVVFQHVFEGDKMVDTYDFTTNEYDVFRYDVHGTNAFSCIGANYNSTLVGTGYDAKFSLYVTEDVSSEYRIEEYNWLFAAERADSAGVDIISSSVGYYSFDNVSMDYRYSQTNGKTSVVSQAAKLASQKGMLVVNSVGNEGQNSDWPYMVFPADVESVLAVAATDASGNRISFSSKGPTTDGRIKPDVAALGFNVAVFTSSNAIGKRSGTSFSAPLISGLAAGLWQKYPELSNTELKELILSSASQSSSPDTLLGYGIPNYNLAENESPVLSVEEVLQNTVSVFPNPFSTDHVTVSIDLDGSRRSVEFVVISPSGQEINRKKISRYRKGEIYEVQIPGVNKGIYILSVKSRGITKNVKLLRY